MGRKKKTPEPEEIQPVEEEQQPSVSDEDRRPKEHLYHYEVMLAKKTESNCFLPLEPPFETNNLKEAESKAVDTACDEEREAVVFDHRTWNWPFVFRHKPTVIVPPVNANVKPVSSKPKPKQIVRK